MIHLSIWEQFAIQAAISILTYFETKIKNATELAALQAALTFLQKLESGGVAIADV